MEITMVYGISSIGVGLKLSMLIAYIHQTRIGDITTFSYAFPKKKKCRFSHIVGLCRAPGHLGSPAQVELKV